MSIDTCGFLILSKDWAALQQKNNMNTLAVRKLKDAQWVKMAEIRKSSERVGEIRFRLLKHITSFLIIEEYTTQKRWYKCMVTYASEHQAENHLPAFELMYLNIEPWIMRELEDLQPKATA